MGRPSQRKHSAQRPGRRERARVKKHSKSQIWMSVGGASLASGKLGRKHLSRWHQWADRWLRSTRDTSAWNDRRVPSIGEVNEPKVAAEGGTATLQSPQQP
jgi:hypothetical protein